jgi:hypothetical protein
MDKMKNIMSVRKYQILIISVLLIIIATAAMLPAGCGSKSVDEAVPVVNGQNDNTGDLFDKNGAATSGESYLDINNVELRKNGSDYILLMKLNGNIPSKTAEASTYIRWDFMIDIDKSIYTGTSWTAVDNELGFDLIANNIGYDYVARYSLTGSAGLFQFFNIKTGKITTLTGRAIQNVIEMTVPGTLLGNHSSFYWTAAVRKYLNGKMNTPSPSDRAPNKNHYVFPAVSVQAPSKYQGSFICDWSFTIIYPIISSGVFSLNVDANGAVEGSFTKPDIGLIAGDVDDNGNLVALGLLKGSLVPENIPLTGIFTISSGNTISVEGECAGKAYSGNFRSRLQ